MSSLNTSGLFLNSSTQMLTPPPSSNELRLLSQQHPHPWGGGTAEGRGASLHDNTWHPRHKQGWQMGHHIRYRVSAWKIYKVTGQWEANTKKALYLVPSSALLRHSKPTLVLAAMEKIISALILSDLPSMQHRLGVLTQLNQMVHQGNMCSGEFTENRGGRRRTDSLLLWNEGSQHSWKREVSWRSGRAWAGMDGGEHWSMSSCFTISSWSTHNNGPNRKGLTSPCAFN